MTSRIPFNLPGVVGSELEFVAQSLSSSWTASAGPFTRRAEEVLREATGAAGVFLTTSGTSALELSALLLDLQAGDCVIVPSFTFTTTALAFARAGARILFVDIEDGTLGIDPADVARVMRRADDAGLRVRAVVAVHYAGIACDLDGLAAVLAQRPEITLVEDNAHGLFGSHQGRPLGSFGRFSAQSFHETKNYSCGEGGALLLNDPADVDRAQVLCDKGTNRRAFLLGQVDKYSWVDTGSSFGMSDILAAVLVGQLEQRARIQSRRRAVFEAYEAALGDVPGVRTPSVPDRTAAAWHMFYVLYPDRQARDAALAQLNREGIQAVFHYVPLHSSVAGRRFSALPADCPVTDDISGRLIRLPLFNTISDSDVERVAAAARRTVPASLA